MPALLDQPALVKHKDKVRPLRHPEPVRRQYERFVTVQGVDEVGEEGGLDEWVEGGEGLVPAEQVGGGEEGAAEEEALPLRTRMRNISKLVL